MRYAVAHGRRSGRGGAMALGRAAVQALRGAGHEVVEVEAGSLAEARARCVAVMADGLDVLVVAGGDGAVSLGTDLCAGTPTALGILPAGTGNDNARSLGIPLGPPSLEVLLSGSRRTLDVMHVEEVDRRVLGSVNGGLDARIAHRGTLLPRRLGALTYTVAALVEIARLRWTPPLHYRLTTTSPEGQVRTEELDAPVVTVLGMPWLGGGLHLSPSSDPADGVAELVVVRPLSPARATVLLRAIRAGRHTSMPEVEVRRVVRVRIEGPADVLAHADGEPLGPLPLTVAVRAADLRVIAPPLS